MSALGKRGPANGDTRYNTTSGAIEYYDKSRGWVPLQENESIPMYTYSSVTPTPMPRRSPPPGPSGVSRPAPTLPHAIETINGLMQHMDDEQLDDLIDAALEELRIRGKGKYPVEDTSLEEEED